MTVILTLGPILFADFEIPDSISCGGKQVLVKQQLIGGGRRFNPMGSDDDLITWSGRFRGTNAEYRAQFLQSLKDQGKPLPLQWSTFSYTVLIDDYKIKYRRPNEIE